MIYPKNLGFCMFLYILMLIVEYNMHFEYESYKKRTAHCWTVKRKYEKWNTKQILLKRG